MSRWTMAQTGTGAVGVLLIIAGSTAWTPLAYAGIGLLGAALALIGLEGVAARRMQLPSRYFRYHDETYTGLAAISHGLLYIVMGLVLGGVAVVALSDGGDGAFQYFVRRPGLVLVFIAAVCGASAVVAASGSVEDRQGPRWQVVLNALTSRLLPALVLSVLAVAALLLGLYEIVSPAGFDAMGGGILERALD